LRSKSLTTTVIRSELVGGAFNLRVNLLEREESLGAMEIAETVVVGGVGGRAGPELELGGVGELGAIGVPETAFDATPPPSELTALILTV
jgi:hypothetical protein